MKYRLIFLRVFKASDEPLGKSKYGKTSKSASRYFKGRHLIIYLLSNYRISPIRSKFRNFLERGQNCLTYENVCVYKNCYVSDIFRIGIEILQIR